MDELESDLLKFLCSKYVQRSDERQKGMNLQYTTAETHDLAKEIASFMRRRYRDSYRAPLPSAPNPERPPGLVEYLTQKASDRP